MASVCRSLQCLISALTQAGGGGHLFRLLVLSCCFPHLRCSGSLLFYMEHALRCARFLPSGVPQKCGTKSCACFLCFPRRSGSGRQELDGHTLPWCGAPSPLRGPSLSFRLRLSGACALCLAVTLPWMLTIQNLRRSLIRNWRPVCSAVGDGVLGAEPAPAFRGAGPVSSLQAVLWTCSVPFFCEQPAVCSCG